MPDESHQLTDGSPAGWLTSSFCFSLADQAMKASMSYRHLLNAYEAVDILS